MGLILGIIIFAAFHIWLLHSLKNWKPYVYDTMFCRDVRASMDIIAYASDIEETRERLNSKKSKF